MSEIAVIFDFDDTLLPDSTSALLRAHGVDDRDFWSRRAREMVDRGYDPPHAYLNLLLSEVGSDRALGELTNEGLREFGRALDSTWFAGLPELFADLRSAVAAHRDISIQFHVISGGLQPIVEGSEYIQQYFLGVYGCQLGEDPETGFVRDVKRCVTFTEKTRFLFEINKGITPRESSVSPYAVNLFVPEDSRPVPMRHMIYVGDGLTDVPCFSLIERGGGIAFGVFQQGAESAKQAFQRLLETRRVRALYTPDYREEGNLGMMLRAAVETVCGKILLERAQRP